MLKRASVLFLTALSMAATGVPASADWVKDGTVMTVSDTTFDNDTGTALGCTQEASYSSTTINAVADVDSHGTQHVYGGGYGACSAGAQYEQLYTFVGSTPTSSFIIPISSTVTVISSGSSLYTYPGASGWSDGALHVNSHGYSGTVSGSWEINWYTDGTPKYDSGAPNGTGITTDSDTRIVFQDSSVPTKASFKMSVGAYAEANAYGVYELDEVSFSFHAKATSTGTIGNPM